MFKSLPKFQNLHGKCKVNSQACLSAHELKGHSCSLSAYSEWNNECWEEEADEHCLIEHQDGSWYCRCPHWATISMSINVKADNTVSILDISSYWMPGCCGADAGGVPASGREACIQRRRDIVLLLSSSVNATEVSGAMKTARGLDGDAQRARRHSRGERISHFYITFPAQQRSLHPRPVPLTWQALP